MSGTSGLAPSQPSTAPPPQQPQSQQQQLSEKDQQRLMKLLTAFAVVEPFAERARQNIAKSEFDSRVFTVSEDELRDFAELCSTFWREITQQHKHQLCHNMSQANLVKAFGAALHVAKCKFQNVTFTEFAEIAEYLYASKFFHFVETLLDEKRCMQLSPSEESGRALYAQTCLLASGKRYDCMDWLSQSYCVFCDAALRSTTLTITQAGAYRSMLECLRLACLNPACARDFIESEPVAYITRTLSGIKMRFQRRAQLALLVDYNASTTMSTMSTMTASLQADPDELHMAAISVAVTALLTSKQLSSSGIIQYLCSLLYSHLNSLAEIVSTLTMDHATIAFENTVWITRALRDLFIGQSSVATTSTEKDALLRELIENNFLASVLIAVKSIGQVLDDRHEALLQRLVSDLTELCSLGTISPNALPLPLALGNSSNVTLGGSVPSTVTSEGGPSPHLLVHIPTAPTDEMIALGVTPKMKLTQAKDKVLNFLSSAIGAPGEFQVPPSQPNIGSTPPLSPATHGGQRPDFSQSAAQAEFLSQCVSLVASLVDLCSPSSLGPLPSVVKRNVAQLVTNTVFSSGEMFKRFDGPSFCTKLLQIALAAAQAAPGETAVGIDLCSSVDSGASEMPPLMDSRIEECVFAAVEHVLVTLRMPATVENASLLQRMAKRQQMTATSFRRVWLLWNTALASLLQNPMDLRKDSTELLIAAHKVLRHFMLSITQSGTRVFASPVRNVGSLADMMDEKERAAALEAEDATARADEDQAFAAFLDVFATLSTVKAVATQPMIPEAVMRGLSLSDARLRSIFHSCLTQLLVDKNTTAVSVCATAIHDAHGDDVQLVSSLMSAFIFHMNQLQHGNNTKGPSSTAPEGSSRVVSGLAQPSPASSSGAGGGSQVKRSELDAFRRQLVECDFIQAVVDRVCCDARTLCKEAVAEKLKQQLCAEMAQLFQVLSIFESRYDKADENIVRLRQLQLSQRLADTLKSIGADVTDEMVRALGQCLLDAATSNYGETATAAAPFMALFEPFSVRQLNCHADKTVFLDVVPAVAQCTTPSVPKLILAATKVLETTGNIDSPILLDWVKKTGRTELLAFLQLPVRSLHEYLPLQGDPQVLKRFWTPLLKLAPKRAAIRFHSSGGVVLTVPSVPSKGLSISFWMYVDSSMRCIPLFHLRGTPAANQSDPPLTSSSALVAPSEHTLTLTLEDFDTVFLQEGQSRRTPINETPIHAFCEKKWVQYTLVLIDANSLRVHVQGRPCGSIDAKYFAPHSKLSVNLGFVGAVQDGQRVFSLADVQVWGDELTDPQVLSDHCHSDVERHSFKILSCEVPRELSPDTPKVPMPFEGRLASFHASYHTKSTLINTLASASSSSAAGSREITAEIVGTFSPPSAGYLDYHLWFATRGGLKLLLKWIEIADSDGEMESAARLFSETVRSVSVAEVIRARLYALAAFHLRANGKYLTEAAAASLVRLLCSQAIVGKATHGIVINKLACDHIASDVGILSRMRTSAALFLLHELQKLFDVQTNKFAKRNASFVVGIRFVTKMIHGIAEHEVLCSSLQREILQLVKKVTQAADFQHEIVQALTSFAAMLIPSAVTHTGKDSSRRVVVPVVRSFTRQVHAFLPSHRLDEKTAEEECSSFGEKREEAHAAVRSSFDAPFSSTEPPVESATELSADPVQPQQAPRQKKPPLTSSSTIENSSIEFSQLNLSVTFAQALSRNILLMLMEFELSKDFAKSLAQVVTVPWYLVCIERFAHPAGVVFATRLFFEAVACSTSLQDAVAVETSAIVESLRVHSDHHDVLFVLLASALGISSHIRLNKSRSFGQQLDDVIGSVKLEPNPLLMPILAGVLQHHVASTPLTNRVLRLRLGSGSKPRELPLRMRRVFNVAVLVMWWVKLRAAAASKATSCTVSRLGSVEPQPTDPIGGAVTMEIAEFGARVESPLGASAEQYEEELQAAAELGATARPGDVNEALQRRPTLKNELKARSGGSDDSKQPAASAAAAPQGIASLSSKLDLRVSLFEPPPSQVAAAYLRESPTTPQTQRAANDQFKDTLLALRLFQKVVSDQQFFLPSTSHVFLAVMHTAFLAYCKEESPLPAQEEEDEMAASGQLTHAGLNNESIDITQSASSAVPTSSVALSMEVSESATSAVPMAEEPGSQIELEDDEDAGGDETGGAAAADDEPAGAVDDDDSLKISLGSTSCDSVAPQLPAHLQLLVEDVQLHAVPIVTLLIRSSLSVVPRPQVPLEAKYGTTGRLLFELLSLSRDVNHATRVAVSVVCDAAEELFHIRIASEQLGRSSHSSPMRLHHHTRSWTAKTSTSVLSSQGPVIVHLPNLVYLVTFFADRALATSNRFQLLESIEPMLILLHRRWPKRGGTPAETAALALQLGDLRDETVRLCLSCLCDQHGNPGEDLPVKLLECVLRILQCTLSRDFTANYRVEQMLRLYYCLYRDPPSVTSEHSDAEHVGRQKVVTATLRFIVRVYKTSGGKDNVLRHALSSGLINRRESIYTEFTDALLYSAKSQRGLLSTAVTSLDSLPPDAHQDSPKQKPESAPGAGGKEEEKDEVLQQEEDDVFHRFMASEARVTVELIMSKRPKSKFDRKKKLDAQRLREFKKQYENFKATWGVATPMFGANRRNVEIQEFYKSHSSGVVELSNVSISNLHWLTFHEVSKLLTTTTGDGKSSNNVGHYLDPKRNVVPFHRAVAESPIAAIDSAISEHLTGHLSTHIPQMMCRCPPYVGDEFFIAKMNSSVVLSRSGMRTVKFLLYPNETVRYICNAFRSSGLSITPCLLILTDATLKLFAYSCITAKGDILLNAFESFRSGVVADGSSTASRRRRSAHFTDPNTAASSDAAAFGSTTLTATKEPERVSMRSKSRSMIAHAANKIRSRARALFGGSNEDEKAFGALYSQSILSLHGGQDRGTEGLCWFFNVSSMTRVHSVAFLQQDAGLSITMLFEDGPMLAIMDSSHSMNAEARNTLVKELGKLLKNQPCEFVDDASSEASLVAESSRWANGTLSNYDYLLLVNRFAGRLRKDLNQYPVFPWVLADFTSNSLDLDNPASFRDLSYPIGAQAASKREELVAKYDSLIGDETNAPFHYGTHYSSAGGILYYLLRCEPYRTLAVELQGGEYDHAARLFHSIAETFLSCTTSSTDCKELIPEFYSLPHFLCNADNLDLGSRSDAHVDDVCLPPWAHGAVDVFISAMRFALESPIVSRNLPLWLDLIFGCKQQGEAARAAINVYQRMTYRSEVNRAMSEASDPAERDAVVAHADNFGQTPRQLFTEPHVFKRPNSFSRVAAILHYGTSDRSRFFVGANQRVQHIPQSVQHTFGTDAAIVSFVRNSRNATIVACPARAIAVPDTSQVLCWHPVESQLLRYSLETGGFVSSIQFQSPFQGVEFVECLYGSRSESVVIAGMSTGTLYGIYPDAVRQWNVIGATLQHHNRPVAGLAVSEDLSRMISFTREPSRTAGAQRSSLFTDDEASPDPPMVWRLTKLYVSAMHVLDTKAAFSDPKSEVIAAAIDDRDSSSIVCSQRELAVFNSCGTLRGVGQLPPEIRPMTAVLLDKSKEWAGGRSVLYSGHQDGSIGMWLMRVLPPGECAHGQTVSIQFVAVIGMTAASPVTAMTQEPISAAAPTPGAATILLELIVGHKDGTVSSLQCIDTKIDE